MHKRQNNDFIFQIVTHALPIENNWTSEIWHPANVYATATQWNDATSRECVRQCRSDRKLLLNNRRHKTTTKLIYKKVQYQKVSPNKFGHKLQKHWQRKSWDGDVCIHSESPVKDCILHWTDNPTWPWLCWNNETDKIPYIWSLTGSHTRLYSFNDTQEYEDAGHALVLSRRNAPTTWQMAHTTNWHTKTATNILSWTYKLECKLQRPTDTKLRSTFRFPRVITIPTNLRFAALTFARTPRIPLR